MAKTARLPCVARKRNAKPGISKSTGYRAQIFNAVYDLRGMATAYGFPFVRWLLVQLEDNVEISSVDVALELWHEHCAELEEDEAA